MNEDINRNIKYNQNEILLQILVSELQIISEFIKLIFLEINFIY